MDLSGEPMRMVNIKDGYAIQLAVKLGIKIAIITGGNSKCVDVRYKGLGVEDVFLGVGYKLPTLNEWMAKYGLKPDEVAFMGDDIPDYEVMKAVGLSCAPADAASDIIEIAKYVSPIEGGKGCGRDLIEQILRAQGKWLADKKAFGW